MCKLGQECCEDEDGNVSCNCCTEQCQCDDGCCCYNCAECCYCTPHCPEFNCFTYANLVAFLRALFLFIHTLLIACSIFGLIWANVYFDTFDRVFIGSFIGGHLVTLSAGKQTLFYKLLDCWRTYEPKELKNPKNLKNLWAYEPMNLKNL